MGNDRRDIYRGREYDDIFDYLNSFGRYQILLFGLINLHTFSIGSQFVVLVFVTGTPGFHCVTPNVTCPDKQCCDGCTSYQFDGPFTSTVSEWNLICDRAYLGATINSCYFGGMLIGSFVTGMISDAWGRKKCMFLSTAIMFVASVCSIFVDSISLFAVCRFVVGFGVAGAMLSLYIYGMELVGAKKRTAAGNVSYIYYGISGMIAALISYLVVSWRIVLAAYTAPAALFYIFWKWIPESPRWLVAHDCVEEAVAEVQKYGAKDGGDVDVDKIRSLLQEVRAEQIKANEKQKKYTPIDLLRTPKMRRWTIIMCYEWFTTALVHFGILLFLSQLSGDVYMNYIIIRIGTSLRIPFTWITFLKFGRRLPHGLFIFVAGISLLLVLAVYKDFPIATTILSILGLILINCNWTGVYLITAELFPTSLRNTAQGTGSTIARIGGIIAPYISMLGQLPGLSIAFPTTIFGCNAVLAGILMYWIPETLYAPMHQTIQQTEAAEEDFGIPCCGKQQKAADQDVEMDVKEPEKLTSNQPESEKLMS